MDRIKNFQDTVEHRQPKDIVMDLGGCRSRAWRGRRQARLLRYLGYDAPDDAPLLFGKVRRLDERLLRALDIDTRSVGEIFRPRESQFRFLADDLYTTSGELNANLPACIGTLWKTRSKRDLRRPGQVSVAGCGQY